MSTGYAGAVRIGELAERIRVPVKTIRYYEEIGLMPEPPRTDSGYRDYHRGDAGRLGFIRAAQSVGLSLGEIREILAFRDRGEVPCSHVAALIERHSADLAERIEALEQMQRDLGRLAKRARVAPRRELRAGEFCHIIETGGLQRRPRSSVTGRRRSGARGTEPPSGDR